MVERSVVVRTMRVQFSLATPIIDNEVQIYRVTSSYNDTKNLALLCRNCHWEYDNGLIGDGEIISIFDIAGVV